MPLDQLTDEADSNVQRKLLKLEPNLPTAYNLLTSFLLLERLVSNYKVSIKDKQT